MNLLMRAIDVAKSDTSLLRKDFLLGAVGLRCDGVIVSSKNERTHTPCSHAHAEARLSKKLTPYSIVAVARVLRNGDTAMAKPCPRCQAALKNRGVKKVFFTTGPGMAYDWMVF